MVITRSGGSGRRKILKGSSSSKGKIFDQEGLVMNPIVKELLNSASPSALVLYGTTEDETPIAKGFGEKESFPLEGQKVESSNLEDNLV